VDKKQLRSQLKNFSLFFGLTLSQLDMLEHIVHEKSYDANEIITREGDAGDELFLLLKGKVEISKSLTLLVSRGDLDTREKSLTQLKAEDAVYFGEMAILQEQRVRSATTKAVEDCIVGIIKKDDLLALFEKYPEFGYKVIKNIAQTLAERLEKANQDILKLTTAFSLALQG
jgi:CRP/FNR family cyclic AMP-dependent transcriptional regulator